MLTEVSVKVTFNLLITYNQRRNSQLEVDNYTVHSFSNIVHFVLNVWELT